MKNLLKCQETIIIQQEMYYVTCIIKSIMISSASIYQDKLEKEKDDVLYH